MSSDGSRRWWRRPKLPKLVSVLLLGQLLSFILALINFTSSLSANLGANSPVTLGIFGYLALTMVNGSILLYQRHELIVEWLYYVSYSFVGVGLFIYSKTEKNPNISQEPENGIPNPQYQLVYEQVSHEASEI